MAEISISVDTKLASAELTALVQKQIPFATATAINAVAFASQGAERTAMTEVFAHPRPFTAKSALVNKASKGKPVATVYVRPEVAKYLQPFETGGAHVLPGKALLDPVNVSLDQYGQLTKGAPKRLAAKPNVFVGTVKTPGGPVTGFWQRVPPTKAALARAKRNGVKLKNHVKLLIRFGNALPVNKHLDFVKRARSIVLSQFGDAFQAALAKALSTAKKS